MKPASLLFVTTLSVLLAGCGGLDQDVSTGLDPSTTGGSTSEVSGTPDLDESRQARADDAKKAQEDLLECFESQGFPSTVDSSGNIKTEVLPGQDEEFQRVTESCRAGLDYGAAENPLTEEEVRWLYDGYVDAYDCLVDGGYEPTPPVSFEVYLSSYNELRPPWNPYDQGQGQAPLPQSMCPPPDLYDVSSTGAP